MLILQQLTMILLSGSEARTMYSLYEKLCGGQTKSYESIELLEDCDLYRMETENLKNCSMKISILPTGDEKLAEAEMIKSEELIISRQFKTSLERYKDIMAYQPELLKGFSWGILRRILGLLR